MNKYQHSALVLMQKATPLLKEGIALLRARSKACIALLPYLLQNYNYVIMYYVPLCAAKLLVL